MATEKIKDDKVKGKKVKNSSKSKASKGKAASKSKATSKGQKAKNGTAPKSVKVKKVKRSGEDFSKKSATLQAIERQKKLEQTMPLGQFTTELPVLGRTLDGPDRRPWKQVNMPKLHMDINPYRLKKLIVIPVILVILLITYAILISVYRVDTVTIEGNTHYTNDEIYNMVLGDSLLSHNSLYLSLKYKDKEIEDVPFVQTMSVHIIDASTIKIDVYEKAMAGFVEYMGRYFYFDKDGTVVESSDVKTKGIPQVMGLNFDHIILYEQLPVESDEIFQQILEMTQLLEKYEIEMDKLYFDSNYNMTLYFGDARIKVGNFDNIDEKIIKLKSILPELAGRKGVLRLDTYDGSNSIITFEVD